MAIQNAGSPTQMPYPAVPDFDPLRSFDAPQVLATQMLQGELTWRQVMSFATNKTYQLAPHERDAFTDRMKETTGNNPFTNTVIDLATNPAVLLLFAFSPLSRPLLGAGRQVLFDSGSRFNQFIKDQPTLLQQLRLLTSDQMLSDHAIPAALGGVTREIDASIAKRQPWFRTGMTALREANPDLKLGRKGLNPQHYRVGTKEHKFLTKLQHHLHGNLEGLDKDVEKFIMAWDDIPQIRDVGAGQPASAWRDLDRLPNGEIDVAGYAELMMRREQMYQDGIEPLFDLQLAHGPARQTGPDGTLLRAFEAEPETISFVRKARTTTDTRKVLREMGAEPLLDAYRMARQQEMVDLFLRPMTRTDDPARSLINLRGTRYVVDREKVMRLWRSQKDVLNRGKDSMVGEDQAFAARGMSIISSFISPEVTEAVMMGKISADRFGRLLDKVVTGMLKGRETFVPRNVFDMVRADGSLVAREIQRERKNMGAFASASALPRVNHDVGMHAGDLEEFLEVVGNPTPSLFAAIKRAHDKVGANVGYEGSRIVHRISPIVSFDRYFRDVDETKALFIAQPDERYLARQAQVFAKAPQETADLPHHGPGQLSDKRVPVNMAFKDADPMNMPLGGFNYSDAVWAEHVMLANTDTRELLSQVIYPATLGRLPNKNWLGRLMAHSYRRSADEIVKNPGLTKFFNELTEDAKSLGMDVDFMGSFTRAADRSISIDQLAKMVPGSRGLANFLYVTHLGLNMGSVLLNAMQPALMVGPIHGIKALTYGYREAGKDMLKYIDARRKLFDKNGEFLLSNHERAKLIENNIRFHDVTDIAPDVFSSMEALAAGESGFDKPTWKRWMLTQMPLKMFEKAEWMNRMVSAHATDYAMRQAGMTHAPSIKHNIEQFVRQTQFGMNPQNTPVLFLKLLSDPTLRQFATFPLRTMTGFLHMPGQLSDAGAWNRVKATAGMWTRATGYGAVLYEAGRHTVGGDLSSGLFPSAATEIFNPDALLSGDASGFAIRPPPVLDIGLNAARWALSPDDDATLRRWFTRLLPAGVALQRAMGSSPAIGDGDGFLGRQLRNLQGNYVDYKSPNEQGQVPVYKADGTLIGYRPPTMMIARGLGLDLKSYQSEAEVDRWLAGNRDAHSKIKREFITSAINGDFARAEELRQRYKKKFKIDLRFTPESMRQQLVTRSIPRSERLLDRLSPDIRNQFQVALAQKANRMGITAEQIMQEATASARTKAGAQRPDPLGPEAEAYLNEYLEKKTMRQIMDQVTGQDSGNKFLADVEKMLMTASGQAAG